MVVREEERASASNGGAAEGKVAVDAYLQSMPAPFRAALQHLRDTIRRAAPVAEEIITYAMPGFRQDGVLVSYSAFKEHLSFFPMSAALMDELGPEIAQFRTSKGTPHFTPANPLPDALVEKIVAARLAEMPRAG